MKRKQPKASRHITSRTWIAAVVAGAIVIVLAVKFLGAGSEDPPKTSVAAGPAIQLQTQAPTSQIAADDARTPTSAQVQANTPRADPFPVDPVSQIEWVQRNGKPAMILFHSTNCIPCKQMDALVAKIREDYEPDVYFIDVITNDQANGGLVQQAGIQAIPTTFFVSIEGKGKRNVGAMKEDVLRAQLDLLRQGGL